MLGVIYLKAGEKSMAFEQHKILKDLDPNKAKQLFDLYWNK